MKEKRTNHRNLLQDILHKFSRNIIVVQEGNKDNKERKTLLY
jgi:hypothetical protein